METCGDDWSSLQAFENKGEEYHVTKEIDRKQVV
jgi:hypothetical protein